MFQLISQTSHGRTTRNECKITNINTRIDIYRNSFLPSSIRAWNELSNNITDATSYEIFKNALLKFIRPNPNSIYGIHDPKGLKNITRLRLGLSHLREHKFKHNFQNTINPICDCGLDIETTAHFLLRCQIYDHSRSTLFAKLRLLDHSILDLNTDKLSRVLLFGNSDYDIKTNALIINYTTEYIVETKRFDGPLF